MAAIERVAGPGGPAVRGGLVELLCDAVADGASVGFLHPLPAADAGAYWDGVFADLAAGRRLLFVARADGRVAGSIQVALPDRRNASHRAEPEKLLVHTSARRRGLGTALMLGAEGAAR